MNLIQAKEKFIENQYLIGNSSKTIKNYNEKIDYFIKHNGNVDLENFDIYNVNGYIFDIMKRDVSRETQRTYIRHIKVFVNYLINNNYIKSDIKIELPKRREIIIDILKPNEIQNIINLYDNCTYESSRNKLMLILFLETGLRKMELLNLHMDNLDLTNKYIKVLGKGQKERLIPLSNYAIHCIFEYVYQNNITGYLFLTADGLLLSNDGFKSLMRRIKLKSKIKRIHAHLFTHTFATYYLIQNNYDIVKLQYILGHTDVKMVMHYLWLAQMYDVVFNNDNRNSVIKGILGIRKILPPKNIKK
jgi:site-specific recombinase XerD